MPLRPPPAHERLPLVLEAKLTAWWKENHRGLLLPPMYPGHRHVWTGIDMGCTVCRVCGIAHVCASAQNVVKCEEIVQVNTVSDGGWPFANAMQKKRRVRADMRLILPQCRDPW